MAALTGLKTALQRDVFHPNDERLQSVVSVTKSTGRNRKKISYLTLSVQHNLAMLSRIKIVDKKESGNTYKRVKSWPVSDLKLVDCHEDGLELDFKFDKQNFKWVVVNASEKRSFVLHLYKFVHKHHDLTSIKFVNVDKTRLEELIQSSTGGETKPASLDYPEESLIQEDYRELTAQEEADLEELLGRENAIQDAASFMENLSEELSQLDQSNIHSLMGSEEQIERLMEFLDGGIMEVEKMEMHLTVYDELLGNVRETMQKLSFQYSHILRQNANLKALCNEVDELISKLDLEPQIERVLQECPLGNRSNLQDCIVAAHMLQKALCQELSQGLCVIQAVKDQTEFFSTLSLSFGRRLLVHLSSQFVHNATVMAEKIASGPNLVTHSLVHSDLLAYQELTKWLKECQPKIFAELMEAYVRDFHRVYEEQLKHLFSESRSVLQLGRGSETKKSTGFMNKFSTSTADIRSSVGGSMSSLSPAKPSGFVSQSIADFGASPLSSVTQDACRGPTFEKVFPMVLQQIQPICVAERKFLNTFFHFEHKDTSMDEFDDEEVPDDDSDGLLGKKREPPVMKVNTDAEASGMLNVLFSSLLAELEDFIDFGEKVDSYNALYLLVSVSQRLLDAFESGGTVSYLDETLKKALLHIRRLFDKFIEERCRQIQESKVPKGNRCGILSCVRLFEEFAERSEHIIMGTDRRAELDKAYVALVDILFHTVERLAYEHPKTPHDVIQFENYNKIVDILARLKIVRLESSKDEARRKYRSHKNEYVKNCLGRPMDKLSVFFEGVEGLRAGGTKAEEVGFRLEFSKNELKKCMKEYPGKEVKRGLDKLYRRVEKEVSEGELQVVWGNMQSSFIQQCQRFQSLISECYPGSNITLEFSIGDIIEYFTTISKSA